MPSFTSWNSAGSSGRLFYTTSVRRHMRNMCKQAPIILRLVKTGNRKGVTRLNENCRLQSAICIYRFVKFWICAVYDFKARRTRRDYYRENDNFYRSSPRCFRTIFNKIRAKMSCKQEAVVLWWGCYIREITWTTVTSTELANEGQPMFRWLLMNT